MTLAEIVEQLRSCNYECEAGRLEDNVAFVELERLATRRDGEKLRENLAAYAHESWSGWMKYLFNKGMFEPHYTNGKFEQVWIMPTWAIERWQRQMNTPYADLPDHEKESDRLEADRMIEVWDKTAMELDAGS